MRIFTISAFLFFIAPGAVRGNEPGSNTVLVMHAGYDSMTVRLNAELISLGYHPLPIHYPPTQLTVDEASSIINAHKAAALINTTLMAERLDIWIADPVTGSISSSETVDSNNGTRKEATMFMKAVELLRARLMKIETPAEEPAPDESPASDVDPSRHEEAAGPAAEPSRDLGRRTALEIGPSIIYGFSDFPVMLQISLGLHVRLVSRLGLDVLGLLPATPMKERTPYGTAWVRSGAAAVGLRVDLRSPERRWVPWLGALIGPCVLTMTGQGNGSYVNNAGRMTAGAVFVRLGMNIGLTHQLSLQTSLHLAWTFRRFVVDIGESRIPWGNPMLGGTLGLAVGLF